MPTPIIIDGKAIAARRRDALAARRTDPLTVGIIVATDDPATATYVSQKRQAAEQVGYGCVIRDLGAAASETDLVAACRTFNADPDITAYIVQLPLPPGVDPDTVLAAVDPAKDADGLSPANLARLYAGDPFILPATPQGILSLLMEYEIPVDGRTVTMVGQGRLTGKPLSALLEQHGATVIRCDSATADLPAATRQADILVVAVGKPGLITAGMVADGAVVIDIGVTRQDGEARGDVDFDGVAPKAAYITPVPGGVGPMTVVSLLENVERLARSTG